MPRNDLLVWMDLEMTSLKDVLTDKIIEVAVILTDKDLNVVAEGPDVIIHAEQDLFDRDPAVRDFHMESGLLSESLTSKKTTEEAELAILGFLKQYVEEKSSPLCGNSIHTDRHFLRVQMPALENHLHYRCIDVSTLKELARRWAPEVCAEAERRKKNKVHRAKNDIFQSIEELKFYRENLFKQA